MQSVDTLQATSWWQKAVIYQIYPRSFMDSNNDGIGDLAGITSKLDYFVWLGIDAIWLSPIYPSPMADFGYDISDYINVEPMFGTLSDFETLLTETHNRNLKLILDFVPNHTSDEHAWFKESRASRDNPKRDWYVWRDPAPDGGPPNNWISHFGGKAWELDETTGQYYLHLFDRKQPDLNWRNPEVRKAMYDVMRFWFSKGVDGFRIDVLWLLIKDEQFRDNPDNPEWDETKPDWHRYLEVYNADRPEVHQIVREMRQVAQEYPGDRVLIGEIYLPYPQLMTYYGQNLDEAQMPFNFQLIQLPQWSAQAVTKIVNEYEGSLPKGAWPNWVLGNHDRPRLVTRIGIAQSRVAQMLLLTLRGTPTCYYGDEIGMHNVEISPEQTVDPRGKFDHRFSRDPVRSPMQWDSNSANAGFSEVQPWLPLAPDSGQFNVTTETKDPGSTLSLFRKLLQLRSKFEALSVGDYLAVESGNSEIMAYIRQYQNQKILVLLNFSSQNQQISLSTLNEVGKAEVLLSTIPDSSITFDNLVEINLKADEGIVVLLQS